MRTLIAVAMVAAFASPAVAQEVVATATDAAKKPSEILSAIEARDDFSRLERMEWDEDGYYEIVYHTSDKARVEINISSTSGQPIDPK